MEVLTDWFVKNWKEVISVIGGVITIGGFAAWLFKSYLRKFFSFIWSMIKWIFDKLKKAFGKIRKICGWIINKIRSLIIGLDVETLKELAFEKKLQKQFNTKNNSDIIKGQCPVIIVIPWLDHGIPAIAAE